MGCCLLPRLILTIVSDRPTGFGHLSQVWWRNRIKAQRLVMHLLVSVIPLVISPVDENGTV